MSMNDYSKFHIIKAETFYTALVRNFPCRTKYIGAFHVFFANSGTTYAHKIVGKEIYLSFAPCWSEKEVQKFLDVYGYRGS